MADAVLNQESGAAWMMYHADCVEVLRSLPDNSIDLSVFSPPFGSLFVYSESERDMGNSSSDGEFAAHYQFVASELLRIIKPGRLVAVHCSDLPMRKSIEGAVGLKDFSGELVRIHIAAGWIYHSRITVWKDPVVEMQRTKAIGLLYKQLRKDSCKSRVGMPDYVLLFRKPGENAAPVPHDASQFVLPQWQEWASPVWTTVDQTNVLNGRGVREEKDERHLCPLQLDIIERLVVMYSNRDDVIISPFAGIGSEGAVSVKMGRKFIGIELKESYFAQACRNLTQAETEASSLGGLFTWKQEREEGAA